MKRINLIILMLVVALPSMTMWGATTKRERNCNKKGVELFNQKRYAEAEVEFRKALQEDATSEVAAYNLAASLIKQSGAVDPNQGTDPMQEAMNILNNLAKSAQNVNLAEKAFYNLGNMAFNGEKYQESIDLYKNSLRRNPDNDNARDNLRIAQLKLKQQQNQNQDKNKDKQDQNKDKDKDKKNQDKQDQKKDQNQDKNQDQNNQDQSKNDQNQKQQPKEGISDANAEKILKTLENEENATRRKVEARQAEYQRRNSVNAHQKPW